MRTDLLISIIALLLLSCAGQRAPEGGPIDSESPSVISTEPTNYTTRFSGQLLKLTFNEYVDHRSVESSLFISPSMGSLEFEWSGTEVIIRFSETLRRSTTYVVTVGTDVADLRNRNKMSNAFTLAFSTGEDIDHGAIEGRVFGRQETDALQGVLIYVYSLSGVSKDTLDPKRTRPDYVTQTGISGDFLLKHLAFGSYRLIAVRDEYKNLLYDPETDEFGVPATDFVLTPEDTMRSDVLIRLSREDTTAVRLLRISAPDQQHVLAEFSSALDSAKDMSAWFTVVDTLNGKGLKILSVCPVYPALTTVLLVTEKQTPELPYRLVVGSLFGANGLGLNPLASSLPFTGSIVRDSAGPSIVAGSVRDSSMNVQHTPVIRLDFSDAVDRTSAEMSTALADSGGVAVPLGFRWLSDASLQLKPKARLRARTWYSTKVTMKRVANRFGIFGKDSLHVLRFQTSDEESFSSIEGIVRDTGVADVGGSIYVVARNALAKELPERVARLTQAGPFTLGEVPEGKYILRSFRDRNGNGSFDYGHVFPHKFSERFTQYSDTLKVRARWPLEGVTMWLR